MFRYSSTAKKTIVEFKRRKNDVGAKTAIAGFCGKVSKGVFLPCAVDLFMFCCSDKIFLGKDGEKYLSLIH